MNKILIVALFLFCSLQAKEIANVTVDGQKVFHADERHFLGLWDELSAEVNVKAEHETILHGAVYGYTSFTGNYGLGASFSIGPKGCRLSCDEISIKGVANSTTFTMTPTVNCQLDLDGLEVHYWEQFEMALTEDQLKLRYKAELGIDTNNITFLKITDGVGCLLRSGPGYNDAPVARLEADAGIAFLGDDRDHRGWIKALACTDKQGWVQVYIGKKLTSMAGDTTGTVDTTINIQPLAKIFEGD
jgi:hypothetical protein